MDDKTVSYQYIPNIGNDEELLFKCLEPDCGEEISASVLRSHAAFAHKTTMYVTDMTTVKDDKRFVVK